MLYWIYRFHQLQPMFCITVHGLTISLKCYLEKESQMETHCAVIQTVILKAINHTEANNILLPHGK